jgi:hypothetical protein|tara:strand:- start:1036 stop:1140 length:105 start_codon:yes stop_codon:yes gene_type:complete
MSRRPAEVLFAGLGRSRAHVLGLRRAAAVVSSLR